MLNLSRFIGGAAIAPILMFALPVLADVETELIPEAAKVLPSDTAYLIWLDVRDETWAQLDQYAFTQVLEASGEDLLNPGGLPFFPRLDYRTEIAPWIGDKMAIALLPLANPQTTNLEEQGLLIAPIADATAFEGLIDTVSARREAEPQRQIYSNVPILHWQPVFLEFDEFDEFDDPRPDPLLPPLEEDSTKALPEEDIEVITPEEPIPDVPGLAIAVLPDIMIAASDPATIQTWIDVRPANEADSLAAQERFQRTVSHPEYDAAIGAFYASVGELLQYAFADARFAALPPGLPSLDEFSRENLADIAALQLDGTIEGLLYPRPQGMRLQGRVYYDDTLLQVLQPFIQPASPQVLETVPDSSYLMFSGQNIAGAWQGLASALAVTDETAGLLEQGRAFFQAFTGLDLDSEFLGWMDQGFAVSLFPTQQTPLNSFFPGLDLGLGLTLQTSDRAAAEYALEQLDANIGQSFFRVEPRLVNDEIVSNWNAFDLDGDNQDDSFLGHGWASDDTLIVTSSFGSLREMLNLASRRQLPNSPLFRRATQDFPEINQGYMYSNLSAVQWLIFNVVDGFTGMPAPEGDAVFDTFEEAIDTLQVITGTSSFTEEYMQFDGVLLMSPAE